MFSYSATLQSYTGVWGRVRSSVHSPPDPSRKLPTAYTYFPPGFLYGSLKNWEVLVTGPTGDAPSLSSCCRSRLGKTRMDPSFKEREGGKKQKKRQKRKSNRSLLPYFPSRRAGVWKRGERSMRKPDPEEHQRAEGLSAPPALWL